MPAPATPVSCGPVVGYGLDDLITCCSGRLGPTAAGHTFARHKPWGVSRHNSQPCIIVAVCDGAYRSGAAAGRPRPRLALRGHRQRVAGPVLPLWYTPGAKSSPVKACSMLRLPQTGPLLALGYERKAVRLRAAASLPPLLRVKAMVVLRRVTRISAKPTGLTRTVTGDKWSATVARSSTNGT
jgi:hypothetical protein